MTEATSWDDYWKGSEAGVAFGAEGADHPLLESFWRARIGETHESRILDVACGRGALLAHLPADNTIYALDYSSAALVSLRETYADVQPMVADVRNPPCLSGSFDLVISQFGAEYGGLSAIDAMPALVDSGGRLILMLHAEGSLIDHECRNNAIALGRLVDSGFLGVVEEMFKAGYGVLRGQSTTSEAKQAALQVVEPFQNLSSLLQEFGSEVAGGTLRILHEETARMQQRIQHYAEEDVMNWIRTMSGEVVKYKSRMDSMNSAALSEPEFKGRVDRITFEGFQLDEVYPLLNEQNNQLGWALSAHK